MSGKRYTCVGCQISFPGGGEPDTPMTQIRVQLQAVANHLLYWLAALLVKYARSQRQGQRRRDARKH